MDSLLITVTLPQSFDAHDHSNLKLYCQPIEGPSKPESIQITLIDGEQKLINLDEFWYRETGGVRLEKKGMPINAVKNGPRGGLTISPTRAFLTGGVDLYHSSNVSEYCI
jgi:hypothetical protein